MERFRVDRQGRAAPHHWSVGNEMDPALRMCCPAAAAIRRPPREGQQDARRLDRQQIGGEHQQGEREREQKNQQEKEKKKERTGQ